MKAFKTYSILILSVLLIKCSCDKPDPKPDPCKAQKPVSADFYIYEEPFSPKIDYNAERKLWEYMDTDTTITEYVRFVAADTTADTYEWQIGEGIYKTKFVVLDFSDYEKLQVAVRLKVTKLKDTTCFPTFKGTDSKTRQFLATQNLDTSEVFGKYFGFRNGNPSDTATMIIYKIAQGADCPDGLPKGWQCTPYTFRYFPIFNLYGGCKSFYDLPNYNITNRELLIPSTDSESCGWYPRTFLAKLNKNKNGILITYSIYPERKPKPNYILPITFTGTKILDL